MQLMKADTVALFSMCGSSSEVDRDKNRYNFDVKQAPVKLYGSHAFTQCLHIYIYISLRWDEYNFSL